MIHELHNKIQNLLKDKKTEFEIEFLTFEKTSSDVFTHTVKVSTKPILKYIVYSEMRISPKNMMTKNGKNEIVGFNIKATSNVRKGSNYTEVWHKTRAISRIDSFYELIRTHANDILNSLVEKILIVKNVKVNQHRMNKILLEMGGYIESTEYSLATNDTDGSQAEIVTEVDSSDYDDFTVIYHKDKYKIELKKLKVKKLLRLTNAIKPTTNKKIHQSETDIDYQKSGYPITFIRKKEHRDYSPEVTYSHVCMICEKCGNEQEVDSGLQYSSNKCTVCCDKCGKNRTAIYIDIEKSKIRSVKRQSKPTSEYYKYLRKAYGFAKKLNFETVYNLEWNDLQYSFITTKEFVTIHISYFYESSDEIHGVAISGLNQDQFEQVIKAMKNK